jgi:hypothetical protein
LGRTTDNGKSDNSLVFPEVIEWANGPPEMRSGQNSGCKRHVHHASDDLLHSGGHPNMRRREFIAVLGGAAAWPLAGHAQQPEGDRRVGVLMPWSENDPLAQASVTAFAHGLERFGWVDGKNIRIDYRFAADDPALFKSNAAELVQLSPDAILASTPPAIVALHQQTATISGCSGPAPGGQ